MSDQKCAKQKMQKIYGKRFEQTDLQSLTNYQTHFYVLL